MGVLGLCKLLWLDFNALCAEALHGDDNADDPDYANMVHVRDRAAKLCGTTTDAIRANLCSKADASQQLKFAYAECPIEGRQLYMRECLKPHRFIGEGMNGKMVQSTEAECAKQYELRSKSW